jgi:N-carbamoyl-L-amino-acid hydrolase
MPKEWANCQMTYKPDWTRETILFDKKLVQNVQQAADQLGYKSHVMYSGAGHDAQYLSEIVPTTMIFVPSQGGHSHCELEYSPSEWCWKGANVLLNTILEIDKQ